MNKGSIYFFAVSLVVVVLMNSTCHNENRSFFYHINTQQYYNSEIFKDGFKDVYGEWGLKAISGGTAMDEFSPDFERIIIQKIGIFKMFRNDSLLAYGRINIQEDKDHSLKISFMPDRGLKNIPFYGTDKYLYLREDHLNLFASCCDQHNYHFIRIK
jgi:hypothetical protein